MIEAVRVARARVVASGQRRPSAALRRAAEAKQEELGSVSARARGGAPPRARGDQALERPPDAAVSPADTGEEVHDFRVALRRLRTVIRIVRDVFGRKRMRKIADGLKYFADATGALRDEEVLRETLTELDVPAKTRAILTLWMDRRRRQERVRRAGVVKLLREHGQAPGNGEEPTSANLEKTLLQLEKYLARGAAEVSPVTLAQRALGHVRADVRDRAGASPSDGEAMHVLRIRFKRLRYTAELFAPVLAPAALAARGAAKLQKRLGELHDLDQALLRVGRAWGLPPRHRATVLAALREARERVATRASEDLAAEVGAWPS